MRNEVYPSGTVLALLQTDDVRIPTKEVLQARLNGVERPKNGLFDDETFATLQAVCDRLFPQDRADKIPLSEMLETALVTTPGVGWRYDNLPPINDTILNGLKGVNAEAAYLFQQAFVQLASSQQDEILRAVQTGAVSATAWRNIPAGLFFTELLVRLTEAYYSHPLAKDEIGDVSFSDAHGWQHLGINNIESREPKPQLFSSND